MFSTKIISLLSQIIFVYAISYYLMTNLQWYNYKLERVIFKHKKYQWHIFYFIIPLMAYYISGEYFWIFLIFGYLPALFLWSKKQDKKLVFTPRVKRFFGFLTLALIFVDTLCLYLNSCQNFGIVLPIMIALLFSYSYEKILFNGFKKRAKEKLNSIPNLKVIAITASYGKTSIKNFIHHIVSTKYNCYKTPRSVNTLAGLIKDVNKELPNNTEVYIAEAGARERGDIDEIARFLDEDYAVVGSIGPAHIEYFKTLENIRNTKMEILNSKKLKRAFVHKSATVKPDKRVMVFGDEIRDIKATLDGVEFSLDIDGKEERFFAPILGEFNAINLTAAILVAVEMAVDLGSIKKALLSLKPVEHRLQKIEAGGKLIIDDSFNGNFEGMSASYRLVESFNGRKVLVTPGIVESDKESNIKLAKIMDEVFDIVIITGTLNAQLLYKHIKNAQKVLLKDKSLLEEALAKHTMPGDLVLFSNDAPTFV